MSEKQCTKCGQSKPATASYFHHDRHAADGLTRQCKACRNDPPLYDVPLPDGYRACSKCHTLKPESAEFFVRSKKARKGLSEQCKECGRAYRLAHKEKLLDYARNYRKENNEELNRKQRIKHAKPESKERRRERDTQNRPKIREYARAQMRRWKTENRDKWRARKRTETHRRRAFKLQAGGSHSQEDVKRQHNAQKGKCYYCGVKVGNTYHVDHVVPLSRGGSDGPENIVIACEFCNTSKRDRLPHEWPQGNRLL